MKAKKSRAIKERAAVTKAEYGNIIHKECPVDGFLSISDWVMVKMSDCLGYELGKPLKFEANIGPAETVIEQIRVENKLAFRKMKGLKKELQDKLIKGELKAFAINPGELEKKVPIQPEFWEHECGKKVIAWRKVIQVDNRYTGTHPYFQPYHGKCAIIQDIAFQDNTLVQRLPAPIKIKVKKDDEIKIVEFYKQRVQNLSGDDCPPTSNEDWHEMQNAFPHLTITREIARQIRSACAPPEWKKQGRRTGRIKGK